MSVRIMTRVWDANFPTLPMKLIALKLADCANDEGENIYPSVGRVERDTGASSSVVRAPLRTSARRSMPCWACLATAWSGKRFKRLMKPLKKSRAAAASVAAGHHRIRHQHRRHGRWCRTRLP